MCDRYHIKILTTLQKHHCGMPTGSSQALAAMRWPVTPRRSLADRPVRLSSSDPSNVMKITTQFEHLVTFTFPTTPLTFSQINLRSTQ